MRTYLVYELADATWVRQKPPDGVLAPGYAVDLAEEHKSRTLLVLVEHAKKSLTAKALAELDKTLNTDFDKFLRGYRVGKLVGVIANDIDCRRKTSAKH
jgi:hypothetical protein